MLQTMSNSPLKTLVLGGGCFWCLEAVYERTAGIKKVVSGYAGGHDPSPDYRKVCGGKTGHAEVVHLGYDPTVISLDEILEIFWQAHDPTTLNRQGADVGTQYRSIILCYDAQEQAIAEVSRATAQARFPNPIVTEITILEAFHPAEQEHQGYFTSHSFAPYCMAVIHPKLKKLGLQV